MIINFIIIYIIIHRLGYIIIYWLWAKDFDRFPCRQYQFQR